MKKTLVASACMLSATYAADKVSAFASVDTSSITATRGFNIVGETGGDEVGYTVTSAGDFNKDTHEDVLITTSKGLAYIVFGKSSSQAAVVFDLADTTKTAADFITITSAETNLVGALAGDIDGDGASDIIIGAPGAGTGAGQAYVIYGTATPADIPDITTLLTGTKGFSFTNPPAGGAFGSAATAVGDINNDGNEDFAISAPASATDDGKVFVILGTSAKRNADVDLNDLDTAPDGFVIIGEVGAAGELGASLAGIGDINGDNFDDILIGAPGDSAAYIVYGMGTIDDVDFSGATTYAKISGAEGSVALAGDFNGGGKDDLIIANPDDGNGKVHIIFGEKLTIDTTTKDVADIDVANLGTTGITITGAAAGDKLGYAVAGVDDVNDDDVDDIVLTAFGTGKAYVLFGSTDIASINLATTLDSQDGVTITGTTAGEFGKSVSAIGDINGDNLADFVISSPKYDYKVDATTTRTDSGAAYVIYGVEQTEVDDDDKSAFKIGASISLIASFLAALLL